LITFFQAPSKKKNLKQNKKIYSFGPLKLLFFQFGPPKAGSAPVYIHTCILSFKTTTFIIITVWFY